MNELGLQGERLVEEKYLHEGWQLLARNYKPGFGRQTGELDLIFLKAKLIVFVEVKTRSNSKFGSPFEAVDFFKQRKLIKTAKMYLRSHPKFADYNYRIDVAAVDVDNQTQPVIILTNAIEDLD